MGTFNKNILWPTFNTETELCIQPSMKKIKFSSSWPVTSTKLHFGELELPLIERPAMFDDVCLGQIRW